MMILYYNAQENEAAQDTSVALTNTVTNTAIQNNLITCTQNMSTCCKICSDASPENRQTFLSH